MPSRAADPIVEARAELAAGRAREALAAAHKALESSPRDPDALYVLGLAHQRCGDLAAAEQRLKQAIAADASAACFHAALGNVLQDRGALDEAIKAYRRALRLQPALAEAHNDLGTAYFARGDSARAAESYRSATALAPLHAVAWANLSAVCRKLGLPREARQAAQQELKARLSGWLRRRRRHPAEEALQGGNARLAARLLGESPTGVRERVLLARARYRLGLPVDEQALAADPNDADALLVLGEIALKDGRPRDAEGWLRRSLELDPRQARTWIRLGDALREGSRLEEAAACAVAALEQDPENARALQQLGQIRRYEGRTAEAERHLRDALRLRPDDPPLLVDLAQVLADQARFDEAFAALEKVLSRDPGSAIALAAKGMLFDLTGRGAQALQALEAARRREPENVDIGHNLAICRLRHGDFARGWRDFELRRQKENFIGRHRRFPFPEWQGEPLAGKSILVYPEQGLGDEIMFSACIPPLAGQARHVALECDPRLEALFRRSFPQCTVLGRRPTVANDWVNELSPRPDYQVPAGSLPQHFRSKPEDFPSHDGFLRADAAKVTRWKARLEALGPGPKIGLSWRGGVAHTGKARRSLSLEQLRPVLELPGRHFVCLQYGDVGKELESAPVRIHYWQEGIDDYDETAALVCALDSVLSVCTAVVHLAGALGRPALVMVPIGAEWRYGAEGERMPWYPSVRLVRQAGIGDWPGVLAEVARRLV
jgi:tetratricopeptide (TPR) repeat protein